MSDATHWTRIKLGDRRRLACDRARRRTPRRDCVYQARQFPEDCGGTLVMDFVQIIGKHESVEDDE